MNAKKMPTLHVYELSRLVHARAADWEKKLKEIREGRDRAYGYYHPMREAVVRLCAGRGKNREKIVSALIAEAQQMSRARGQNPEKDNLSAFESFESACHPRIAKFVRSLLRTPQENGVAFEGILLTGAPHFEAVDRSGTTRFVFLHASKWTDEDLKAYLELLCVILEKRFGAVDGNLWYMDLRNGKTLTYRASTRMRQRCINAAHHFCRLADS